MLEDLLIKEKAAIVSKWKELLIGTYPPETQRFLKNQKNRFANPVGSSIEDGLEGLYNGLIQEGEAETTFFSENLDRIIRVRAVQGFAPSSAVGFVFLLKDAVREVLGKTIRERGLYEELLEFEERLDGLALLAFNIYMQCRETLFDIKASEIRDRSSRLIDRACQKYGMPHEWADSPDTKS